MSECLLEEIFFGLKMKYHYALRNSRAFGNTRQSSLREAEFINAVDGGLDKLLLTIFALNRTISALQVFFGYADLHLLLRRGFRSNIGLNLMLNECLVN